MVEQFIKNLYYSFSWREPLFIPSQKSKPCLNQVKLYFFQVKQVIFSDFNRDLTDQFSNQYFLKVNLENFGLTWFELVKIVRF